MSTSRLLVPKTPNKTRSSAVKKTNPSQQPNRSPNVWQLHLPTRPESDKALRVLQGVLSLLLRSLARTHCPQPCKPADAATLCALQLNGMLETDTFTLARSACASQSRWQMHARVRPARKDERLRNQNSYEAYDRRSYYVAHSGVGPCMCA